VTRHPDGDEAAGGNHRPAVDGLDQRRTVDGAHHGLAEASIGQLRHLEVESVQELGQVGAEGLGPEAGPGLLHPVRGHGGHVEVAREELSVGPLGVVELHDVESAQ